MSKFIVETTGSFTLVEPHQIIPYNRPAVVSPSHFLEIRGKLGQVRILAGGLDEAATDAEFAQYLKDSEDQALAIAAFVDKYDGDMAPAEGSEASNASSDSSDSTPPKPLTKAEKKAAEQAAKAAANQDGAA